MTTNGLDALAGADRSLETLLSRYFARISQLHGHCFYDANFNPQTERRIRETADYIEDAQRLAEGETI